MIYVCDDNLMPRVLDCSLLQCKLILHVENCSSVLINAFLNTPTSNPGGCLSLCGGLCNEEPTCSCLDIEGWMYLLANWQIKPNTLITHAHKKLDEL